MLTKSEHDMLRICGFLASSTLTLPFEWNSQRNKLNVNSSKLFKIIGFGSSLLHSIFLIIRINGYSKIELESLHYSVLIHAITLLCQISIGIIQIGCIINGQDVADIINQLLMFNVING